MTTLTTKIAWAGGLAFEGTSTFGHKIRTDVKREAGGEESGHRPTELLLYAIASCTGVDIVNILRKQRQDLTGLEIEVIGTQRDEYPKAFVHIEIKYTAHGNNLDPAKVAQAIELSESKYCSVSETVRRETHIETKFDILPA